MSQTYDAQIWALLAASLIVIMVFVGYALRFQPVVEVAAHQEAVHARF